MSKVVAMGMDIPVDKIKPSPYQPRLIFHLDDLVGSIKKDGILVDLLVRKKTDYFELIDGERRLRVAKQLNLSSVPCKIVDVDDNTAMGMVYTVNQEREEYSLRENVRYATLLLELNQNITSIAEKMRRSRPQVRDYLNVSKLPKKYQEYLWANKFGIGHLHEVSSLLNGGGASTALKHLDVVLERKLTRDEFRKYLRPYLADVEEKRVDSAKEAAGKIEPTIKDPETPEDLRKAAKALRREASRKEEAEKTAEQRAAEKAEKERIKREAAEEKLREAEEKARSSLLTGKNNAQSRIDKAIEEGIDATEFTARLKEIKATITEDPKKAFEKAKELKNDINTAIRDEQIRKEAAEKAREEERKKLEAERERLEAEAEKKLRVDREKIEEERKKLEAERKRLEAERKRLEAEAEAELEAEKDKLRSDPVFISEIRRDIISPPVPKAEREKGPPRIIRSIDEPIHTISVGLDRGTFQKLSKFMKNSGMILEAAIIHLIKKGLEMIVGDSS